MDGDDINGFLENMTRECDKELERIRAEGETRMSEFASQSEGEFALFTEELAGLEKRFIDESIAMEKNRWALDYRRRELQRFEMYLNDRIHEAVKFYRTLNRDAYGSWMRRVFAEILEESGTGSLEIIISPDDVDISKMIVDEYTARGGKEENCRITVSSSITMGGIRVHCADKPVEYDCTVERILFRLRDEIRLAVRKIIDGGENSRLTVDGENCGN